MITLPTYGQDDGRWSAKPLGDPRYICGNVGCYVTSTAMLLGNFGIVEDPGTLIDKLNKVNGFSEGQESYAALMQLFPQLLFHEAVWTTNLAAPDVQKMEIQTALKRLERLVAFGMCPILCVQLGPAPQGSVNHAVVLYDAPPDLSRWRIKDPWRGLDMYFSERYGDPTTGVKGYRSIIGPPIGFPDYGLPEEGQTAWKLSQIAKGINIATYAKESLDNLLGV